MIFCKKFTYIKGDIVNLKLILTAKGDEKELPYYWFQILDRHHIPVGKISLRIGHNYHSYFNGNIGYEIDKEYRGNNYSYYASLMVLKVAKYHYMDKIYMTCDSNNLASYKTIEKLGAKFIEEIRPPKDYIFYYPEIEVHKIYELNLE